LDRKTKIQGGIEGTISRRGASNFPSQGRLNFCLSFEDRADPETTASRVRALVPVAGDLAPILLVIESPIKYRFDLTDATGPDTVKSKRGD